MTRDFIYKKKYTSDDKVVSLASGDIMVMAGKFQDHYIHMIPQAHTIDERFNLTFRFLTNHLEGCSKAHGMQHSAFTGLFSPEDI